MSADRKVKVLKKRTKPFIRHKSDEYFRLSSAWRKPRGIDNPVRRRYRGNRVMPGIGYGTDKRTRHMMPNGLKRFLIHNVKELDILLMHNKTYAAEVAHGVSARQRIAIVNRARELNVQLTNGHARLVISESN